MAKLIKIVGRSDHTRGHVIFVHGLGGHAYDTWRYKKNEESFWPLWLAQDINGLTVWTLSYDAPPTNWLGQALPLQDQAIPVLEMLLTKQELTGTPIVFVCHSLGGLIVKQFLRSANDQRKDRAETGRLIDQVKAVVFYATPHTGSDQASWLERLRLIAWPSVAARGLVRNDANLRELNIWYRNWSEKISHKIFYESRPTLAGVIVKPDSADAGLQSTYPIASNSDHLDICKPQSRDDPEYSVTQNFLLTQVFNGITQETNTPATECLSFNFPPIQLSKPTIWPHRAVRIIVLVFFLVILTKGTQALFFPSDPLQAATVQQIEEALQLKHPDLTPEQIDRFIQSLREARGDPTFDKALEEATNGNTRVAEGILRQIYEDRKRQRTSVKKEQARAARNLAAIVVVDSISSGLNLYREATNLDPENREGWLGLGDAALVGGTTTEAKEAFNRYLTLVKKYGDEREHSLGYSRYGNVLVKQGNLTEALVNYQTALDIRKHLAQSDPENASWQRDLSVSHEKIGDVLVEQGNLTEALVNYQTQLDIAKHLAQSDPENASWQRDLAWSHWRIAQHGNKSRDSWGEVVRILQLLNNENKLAPIDMKWLQIAEENLEASK